MTTRVEEANLGGSVLPRQQSALLFEAIAKEVKGVKFEEKKIFDKIVLVLIGEIPSKAEAAKTGSLWQLFIACRS